ncbi:hypothetical protein EV363DRAFT_742552 [Boletus edulis]|nr:hypothetical protein EV363DRAFT_742552 [Boletus edulis]
MYLHNGKKKPDRVIIYLLWCPSLATVNRNTDFTPMKPIDALKKGLIKLCDQIRERKEHLTAELRIGAPISDADQEWLDGEGNLIDEERVVEALDGASNYELSFERLSEEDKTIAQKLQKLAGGGGKSDAPKCIY